MRTRLWWMRSPTSVVHIGFFHLDIVDPCRRVQRNVEHLCAFANHLFVHLAFRRHVNHDIALNRGLTAKAATIDQAAFVFVALLNRIPFGKRAFGDCDPVF